MPATVDLVESPQRRCDLCREAASVGLEGAREGLAGGDGPAHPLERDAVAEPLVDAAVRARRSSSASCSSGESPSSSSGASSGATKGGRPGANWGWRTSSARRAAGESRSTRSASFQLATAASRSPLASWARPRWKSTRPLAGSSAASDSSRLTVLSGQAAMAAPTAASTDSGSSASSSSKRARAASRSPSSRSRSASRSVRLRIVAEREAELERRRPLVGRRGRRGIFTSACSTVTPTTSAAAAVAARPTSRRARRWDTARM